MISRQLPEPLGDGRPRITVTRCSAWRRWRESRCLCDSEVVRALELMHKDIVAKQKGGSPELSHLTNFTSHDDIHSAAFSFSHSHRRTYTRHN